MNCEGCENELESKKDEKFGFCADCRRKAFGFNIPGRRPRHTEQKDRHTANYVGCSAAEFETGRMD